MPTVPEHILLHIDGKGVAAADDGVFEVRNPATGKLIHTIAAGTVDDVDRAVQAGRAAFDDGRWRDIPARARARILNRAAGLLADRIDEYARMETEQIGRPLREMRAQLARLPEWLEYFGALAQTLEGTSPDFGADHLNVVRRVPLGVVGLITPWNHPLLITMKKVAVALAAGNSLVLKPSELGPAVPGQLVTMLEQAGVPPGVVNFVPGLGRSTGKALTEHRGIAKLDVTGGTGTGRVIAAAAGQSLIPVTAELGGKAPVLVFDDVDIGAAVAGALFAAFIATGQTCVQGARILVSRKVYEQFASRLVARTGDLRMDDPLDVYTQIGPLVSQAQRDKTADAVDRGRRQGGTVLAGGRIPEGWFYEPTIVADVGRGDALWSEEVFGVGDRGVRRRGRRGSPCQRFAVRPCRVGVDPRYRQSRPGESTARHRHRLGQRPSPHRPCVAVGRIQGQRDRFRERHRGVPCLHPTAEPDHQRVQRRFRLVRHGRGPALFVRSQVWPKQTS
jgi:acyl-CoA reductase-like NAD-dependent aldehyde dehydrogenase